MAVHGNEIDTALIFARADFIFMHRNAQRLADSAWLESEPWHLYDIPILIDSECKNIHTLAACAGVHENFVPLAALERKWWPSLF